MQRTLDRRTVLIVAGAAAFTMITNTVAAQRTDIRGAIKYKGGAVIPKGHIVILLEDPAIQDNARHQTEEMRVRSNGKSKTVAFSIPAPEGLIASPTLQIVAHLERADGWLLARGSTKLKPGTPVDITLSTAIY